MSAAADAAKAVADTVMAGIPSLIHESVVERREHACWYELYRAERARTATTWIGRRVWTALARKSAAKCRANKAMHTECAAARERVGVT